MLFQAHPLEVSAPCLLHPLAPDCLKISIIVLQSRVIKTVAGAQKGAFSVQGAALSALRKSLFRYCHHLHLAGEQTAREAGWLLRAQSQAGAGQQAPAGHAAQPGERCPQARHKPLPCPEHLAMFSANFPSCLKAQYSTRRL